ncbi:helix-turn-helix domain-containing protein [Prauserella oleivorans]|uniref:Helix-turn-helix domain-containing protein n=1 Tax=Prauserella oleivorans TaxID=1478153 RepID=A0ABW5WGY9_9PSEU
MSTRTPDVGDELAEVASHATDPRAARAAQVNARTQKLYDTALQREMRKAPGERRSERVLWREARKQAEREVRGEAVRGWMAEHTKAAVTTVTADIRSAVHRNRRQLAPLVIAAPFALLGFLANLVCSQGTGQPLGVSALVTALAAVGAWFAWSKGAGARFPALRARVPAAFRAKVQAGLGVGVVFVAIMPFTPWSEWLSGPWLLLVFATFWLSLSWWRHVDHPIPGADDTSTPEPVIPETGDDALAAQPKRIQGILAAWAEKVAAGKKPPVRGSTLRYLESTDSVDSYAIELDEEGDVTASQVGQHLEKIAMRIGVLPDALSFEPSTSDPCVVYMRHLVGVPDFTYTGPVVLCDGEPVSSRWEITPGSCVDIVYGYYLDGRGHVAYRVVDEGGVLCHYILGSSGSGKTVQLEVIGIALRFLGAYLIYADGQNGASSQTLAECADEFYTSAPEDIDRLARRLIGVCAVRNRELRENKALRNRYSYDPHRPPIIVMFEEGHRFWEDHGHLFGKYGSEIRKLGVGYVGASQDFDLAKTFGGSSRLRDAFQAGGSLACMRLTERTRTGMLPASCPDLTTVPKHGYGFAPYSERPAALWRTPRLAYTAKRPPKPEDGERWPEDWMRQYDPAELDPLAQAGLDMGQSAADDLHADTSQTSTVATVVHFPGASSSTTETEAEDLTAGQAEAEAEVTGRRGDITEAQRRVLAALTTLAGARTAQAVADELGISRQGAEKHLKALVDKGKVVREHGLWKVT